METIVDFCEGLPEKRFAAGEVVLPEGGKAGLLYILADGAVEIDFLHADIFGTQRRSQHAGKLVIERELATPACAARPGIGKRMTNIDSDARRGGTCCGQPQKTGKNEIAKNTHAWIIAAN